MTERLGRGLKGRLLFSNLLDQFASSLISLGLPIIAFGATGNLGQSAALLIVNTLPVLVFGLYAGTLADRFNRKVLVVATNSLRALLLLLSAVLYGEIGILGLGIVAFAVSALGAFERPASLSVLPAIFGDGFKDFMATRGGLLFLAQTLGPIAAGSIATLLSAPLVLVAAGILLAGSLSIVASIRGYEPRGEIVKVDGAASLVTKQVTSAGDGLRYLASNRVAGGMLLYWVISIAAVPVTTLTALPYITKELGLPTFAYGAATAVYASGCVISSIAMKKVAISGRIRKWLAACGIGYAAINMIMPTQPPFVIFLLLWLCWGLCYGPEEVLSQVLFAKAMDPAFAGRVYSFMTIAFALGSIIGYAVLGPIASALGSTGAMFVGGVAFLFASTFTFILGPIARGVSKLDTQPVSVSK